MAGGLRVGVWKPQMKRHNARFGAETYKQESEYKVFFRESVENDLKAVSARDLRRILQRV